MSDYCLTINIKSADRQLLDDLVITFESANDNLDGIKNVDIFLYDEDRIDYASVDPDSLRVKQPQHDGELLERWMVNDDHLDD